VSHNQRVGKWGEQTASDFLTQRGYQIVARNLRTPYGEIDLLAQKDGFTVFVEVKARLTESAGLPEASVNTRKQAHMTACAEHYAQQHAIDHWQIDVIAIRRVAGKAQITHFENAVSE
jgi:putative endonuclease